MSMTNGVVGSLVGGAVGALVWMGVTLVTDHEVGWIAWGVGGLAGAGMSLGMKGNGDVTAGVIAALIAVVSVFAGKYAAVHFIVQKEIDKIEATPIGASQLQLRVADELVEEWKTDGRNLVWPAGMTVEKAQGPKDYPDGVWDEAVLRFDSLSAEERAQMTKEMSEYRSHNLRSQQSTWATEGFKESLGGLDLLWAGLAVATAFRLASRNKEAAPAGPAV